MSQWGSALCLYAHGAHYAFVNEDTVPPTRSPHITGSREEHSQKNHALDFVRARPSLQCDLSRKISHLGLLSLRNEKWRPGVSSGPSSSDICAGAPNKQDVLLSIHLPSSSKEEPQETLKYTWGICALRPGPLSLSPSQSEHLEMPPVSLP